jgi:hypothetical protein
MLRRQPRAIFRGVFKPNFLLSWPSVRYVVQLLFRGSFRALVHLVGSKCN